MIATRDQAQRIIERFYGAEFTKSIRFNPRHGVNVLVRPSYETAIGLPTICWRKLLPGQNATIWLGELTAGGGIDWNWSYKEEG